MAETEYVRVGTVAEVPDGELRAFDVPWGHVAVAHIENELFALGDTCTHDGCPLSEGKVDDHADTVITDCDTHYDLRTGEPLEGPARDPAPLFAVRESDGWLEIAAQPSPAG
jgi:nitrite reductase/ring-hydroxylating ferredoxin subunit